MTTENSSPRLRKAAAGPSTSKSRNQRKSEAMSDKNVISDEDRDHKSNQGDDDRARATSHINRLHTMGIITRGGIKKDVALVRRAIIIFPSKDGGPGNNSARSDVFRKASKLFSQDEIVEVTVTHWPRQWKPPNLDGIHIEGEETLSVPVFDSCDEVRSKIEAYMNRKSSPARYGLCKAIFAQVKHAHFKGIDTIQFDRFMAKRGPAEGARDVVYYAAYVFFEKLRIAEGRAKSEKRLKTEAVYPHGFKYKLRKRGPSHKENPVAEEHEE